MGNPTVADNQPISALLTKGQEYFYCTCGKSATQPFCDGSHQGTDFVPLAFTAQRNGVAALCQCKQTSDPPFCDGTHHRLPADAVGQEISLASLGEPLQPEAMPAPVATAEEPTLLLIHQLAEEGLSTLGPDGPIAAMGVPRCDLPAWDDIQIMVAQLSRQPLLEDQPVGTETIIGPAAQRPLRLAIPLFVSDMSFGALSAEAKTAMAKGAQLVGTGICSGEGGMLPEEQEANQRYLYELASAKFGFREDLLKQVQAFHFKCGQAAKTGTGGHLPGIKNTGRISQIRGLPEGQPAISPATFTDLHSIDDFRRFSDRVRDITGGIPIGFKLSAQHIEPDINFAVQAGADYIILDGRGGGTGAAPLMFRDHITVPTIPALARARHALDQLGASGRVSLVITGGLRTHTDFIKALALGADAIAVANAAMQAIGCIGARICHTNLCPAGIATQDPALRRRLQVDHAALRLRNYFQATTALMQVMARACGHDQLNQFHRGDLSSWHRDLAQLAGIEWSGFDPAR